VGSEGLGKLIKIIHLIGSRTRDLPVCNITVTQVVILLRLGATTLGNLLVPYRLKRLRDATSEKTAIQKCETIGNARCI
jgi:hypothetical protein